MNPQLLTLVSGLISTATAAQEVWAVLGPILSEGRDPTPSEWRKLDSMADAAHAAVQQS